MKSSSSLALFTVLATLSSSYGFVSPSTKLSRSVALSSSTSPNAETEFNNVDGRRQFLSLASAAVFTSMIGPDLANASGGATAGKYT